MSPVPAHTGNPQVLHSFWNAARGPSSRARHTSFRDALGLARHSLAAASASSHNASGVRSLDVKRWARAQVSARTAHTHTTSPQVRAWPLDAESRGGVR